MLVEKCAQVLIYNVQPSTQIEAIWREQWREQLGEGKRKMAAIGQLQPVRGSVGVRNQLCPFLNRVCTTPEIR